MTQKSLLFQICKGLKSKLQICKMMMNKKDQICWINQINIVEESENIYEPKYVHSQGNFKIHYFLFCVNCASVVTTQSSHNE